jgi:hypothetical protein
MQKDKILLIKINKVVGTLYIPAKETQNAIIYAKGGPSLGDDGKSPVWAIAKKYNYVLFIPDYIGFCRSDGIFSFKGCIETINESEQFLKGKVSAHTIDTGEKIEISTKNQVLIGSSWGGAIVPFYEKFRKSSIRYIGLIKPVTDWKSQGRTNDQEENVELTAQSIKNGWGNIYRGFSKSLWPKIFLGQVSECNPIDCIRLLQGKYVIICHGKKDDVVNWKKSKKYYEKLQGNNIESDISYFENEGHSSNMNVLGLEYILKKIQKNMKGVNTYAN